MKSGLLTPDEAATMLKVTPGTIREWLRKGTLRGIKVGGGRLWRIHETEIDKFLNEDQDKNNLGGE